VYLWVACLYFCGMAAIPFFDMSGMSHVSDFWSFSRGFFWLNLLLTRQRKWEALHPDMNMTALTFAFVLAAAIWVTLTLMTGWNFYLILSAQTTIEFYTNKFDASEQKQKGVVPVNEYDLGTVTNFKVFFNIGRLYAFQSCLPGHPGSTHTCMGFFFFLFSFFSFFCSPWWMILLPVAVPGFGDGTSYPTVRGSQIVEI